jgi:hypothetical protein
MMRFLCLFSVLVCALAEQAGKPDKLALRQQIAEMKVKAFEMQTQIELLERQLHDVEEAESNQPVASPLVKAAVKVRCSGHTKDGKRCSRNAEAGSRFCWQHKARR